MAQEYYGGTPISGTYTPKAANVNLDSITGMTAENVQEGIEELKTSVDGKAPSSHTHTKSQITDMFSVVDDLTTGGSTNALSAEMGKQLNSSLTQWEYFPNASFSNGEATVQVSQNAKTRMAIAQITGGSYFSQNVVKTYADGTRNIVINLNDTSFSGTRPITVMYQLA